MISHFFHLFMISSASCCHDAIQHRLYSISAKPITHARYSLNCWANKLFGQSKQTSWMITSSHLFTLMFFSWTVYTTGPIL